MKCDKLKVKFTIDLCDYVFGNGECRLNESEKRDCCPYQEL